MFAAGFFSKQRIVAPPGFNRWRVPPACVAIHLCIGSVYAWSIFNPQLTRIHGVVASGTGRLDAGPGGLGIHGGDRRAGAVGRICRQVAGESRSPGGGHGGRAVLGRRVARRAAGIAWHQLALLYFGYGVVGGCGLGLGYVSPVSTLIRWFPDRRGMATGLAIMGFGGGAMIAAPLNEALMRIFYRPPQYLGQAAEVELTTIAGRRVAMVDGQQRAVVVLAAGERAQLLVPAPEGVYVVGTGNNGAAETFLVLGLGYLVCMLAAALAIRIRRPTGAL